MPGGRRLTATGGYTVPLGRESRGTSSARPERTKTLDKLAVALRQILRDPPETPLVCLRRSALNAATGQVETWEPGGCHRHERDPPEVHDEGSGLTVDTGLCAVERQHPKR
jgi:hypothetical protein